MKILFTSAEVYPIAKVGGLADVTSALSKALKRLGHDIRLVMPKYGQVNVECKKVLEIRVPFPRRKRRVLIYRSNVNDVPIYLLRNDGFFGGKKIYDGAEENALKFAFFSKSVAELLRHLNFMPDVIHANDWHTGLIPFYVKLLREKEPQLRRVATVFTIHNLKYQGMSRKVKLKRIGLPDTVSNIAQGRSVNPMKAGIIYSDVVNTVSRTYAKEIANPKYGCKMDPYLRKKEKVYGIINGLDYDVWNPEKDNSIYCNYGNKNLGGKLENKRRLLQEVGLPVELEVPLLGMVSRLDAQKGFDLITDVLLTLLKHERMHFILLGTGQAKYVKMLRKIGKDFLNAKFFIKFDEKLAHKIYAGCDIFLMPSKSEPCGLTQLISLRYGTIPVVRKTGGLADTIIDYDEDEKHGNGFVFEESTSVALESAIKRALEAYRSKKLWRKLMKKAMKADYSWNISAKEYIKLYEIAIRTRNEAYHREQSEV